MNEGADEQIAELVHDLATPVATIKMNIDYLSAQIDKLVSCYEVALQKKIITQEIPIDNIVLALRLSQKEIERIRVMLANTAN